MSFKILNNVLQNGNKCFNLNNFKMLNTINRYLSRAGVGFSPKTAPAEISVHIDGEIRSKGNVQEEILLRALESGKTPSSTDWESLKNSVLSRGKFINELNFDAKALGYCITFKNLDAGKSLLELYQSKNEKFNIGAMGKFLKLCHVCNEENSSLNTKDEKIILETYRQIKQQFPILTAITAENIIPALSLTTEWERCLDLLDTIRLSQNPSIGTYSVVVKAAFANNNDELAWKLIEQMSNEDRFPHPTVYKTWLKKASESQDVIKNVDILFKYFVEYDVVPTKDVTDQIIETLEPFEYRGIYGNVTKNGICESCDGELNKIKIKKNEFDELKSAFMNNVIVGKNVFTKTDPEELLRFKNFVDNKKYDVVVDGLNIAYSAGTKHRSDIYGKLLANVVRHLRLKNNNILVLGRKHMNKWPQKYMDYVNSNATMFLTQDMSQDDPFLLYATMSSGLGTNFLSRDNMRSHIYSLMDKKLKTLFRRWQQIHQYSLIYAENNGHIHIKKPFPYLCVVHKNKRGWHIPYVDNYVPIQPMTFEPPKNWLCICKN